MTRKPQNSQRNIFITSGLWLFLFATIPFVGGCSFFTPYKTPITQGTIISQEAIDTLQAGLTANQVRELLGPPMGQDPFYPTHWEYVFYTTDDTFQPDAAKHLIVQFDQDYYLERWKVIDKSVQIERN